MRKNKWEKRGFRSSFELNDDRNAFFSHTLDLKHTFNFSQVTLIKLIHCKKSSRLLGSAIISHSKYIIKQCPDFYQISLYLADIILRENNIEMENG